MRHVVARLGLMLGRTVKLASPERASAKPPQRERTRRERRSRPLRTPGLTKVCSREPFLVQLERPDDILDRGAAATDRGLMFAPRVSSTGAKLLFAASAAFLSVVYLCFQLFSVESMLRERQKLQQFGPPVGVEAQESGGASGNPDKTGSTASGGRGPKDRERPQSPQDGKHANPQNPSPATHLGRGASPSRDQNATPTIRVDADASQALGRSRPDEEGADINSARPTPRNASGPLARSEGSGVLGGVGSLASPNRSAAGRGRPTEPHGSVSRRASAHQASIGGSKAAHQGRPRARLRSARRWSSAPPAKRQARPQMGPRKAKNGGAAQRSFKVRDDMSGLLWACDEVRRGKLTWWVAHCRCLED